MWQVCHAAEVNGDQEEQQEKWDQLVLELVHVAVDMVSTILAKPKPNVNAQGDLENGGSGGEQDSQKLSRSLPKASWMSMAAEVSWASIVSEAVGGGVRRDVQHFGSVPEDTFFAGDDEASLLALFDGACQRNAIQQLLCKYRHLLVERMMSVHDAAGTSTQNKRTEMEETVDAALASLKIAFSLCAGGEDGGGVASAANVSQLADIVIDRIAAFIADELWLSRAERRELTKMLQIVMVDVGRGLAA